MSINLARYSQVIDELAANIKLVAVSKSKPAEDIMALYQAGQRDFGENYVQELVDKYNVLPKDIHWHFIGHLQTNKVKYISAFITLIHGVDTYNLLKEIDKQAKKNDRVIDCLLQVHIAKEETKFGMNEQELSHVISRLEAEPLRNLNIKGLMGIASFTDDIEKVREEFRFLKRFFLEYSQRRIPNVEFSILSMGMSADYKVAVEEGSNMVRIGSLVFGARNVNA